VAIKIQYPNVAESVDSDLKNLQRVMNYTGFFPKNLFMDRIIENARNELHEECDYIIEREKQLKYREMLKNDPRYYVPKIIDELSTKEVLTGEYVDGLSMNELEEFPQPIRDEIATRVMELTFK
jgi:aarF domain-containing kinase